MKVKLEIELPDERTLYEVREVLLRFHEEYDDVHVVKAHLLSDDGEETIDMMTKWPYQR